jgi:hypothetical protein
VNTWFLSLLSVAAVSSVSLLGVMTISLSKKRVHDAAAVLVSFAVGACWGMPSST